MPCYLSSHKIMHYHWAMHKKHNPPPTLLCTLPHLNFPLPTFPLSWKVYTLQWQYKGPLPPLWLFSLTLIFCPSRGRGLVLSCLSARQFYLSIAKPSTTQRPQHCINPLSASQPSITLLSIMSDPSSAHLSHTAHPLSWSPQRAPPASHRGWKEQPGRRKLEESAKHKEEGD